MTLPEERIRAIRQAELLLIELTDPKMAPGVPLKWRKEARQILRHYPSANDLPKYERAEGI